VKLVERFGSRWPIKNQRGRIGDGVLRQNSATLNFRPRNNVTSLSALLIQTDLHFGEGHGGGVVVPGCPACMKRINTMSQFLDHLADDVLPALIEKLSADAKAQSD
jgi:hypothetical protein